MTHSLLSGLLILNLLICVGVGGLMFATWIMRKMSLTARAELQMHYAVLATLLALSVTHPWLPRQEFFAPPAKIWSAPSIKLFTKDYVASGQSGYLTVPTPMGESALQVQHISKMSLFLIAILVALSGLQILRDLIKLFNLRRQAFLIRKIGRVQILLHEGVLVPFSSWLPGSAYVVIPASLPFSDYKMAIFHELQHHRQGDTRWIYIMWALKWICFFNPLVHVWSRWISEIQEFACDETLVDRNKVESQAYARCLIEVAQTAISQKHVPVCATGLTFLHGRKLLKRRIEKMLTQSPAKVGWAIRAGLGLFIAAAMSATAFASKGLVQDRRITMEQARAMSARAQTKGGFPVVVNDLVVKYLNYYVGTPEGREFMRSALARMENHKGVVGSALRQYDVPSEIMAVPIVESGYKNLTEDQSHPSIKAAGIWQFIPKTALNYGLRVDEQKDDRIDIPLSTDAAMRYLQVNNLRFKDWQLSVLAYNMGEEAVQKGINKLGSRDAWTLIRNGYEGDKGYLPKVMAAILVMQNPEMVMSPGRQ